MNASVNILTYILEDDVEVHEIINQLLIDNGILKYHIYDDPVIFMNDLTADINICVIDHKLKGGLTGTDVIKAVKEKNKRSYVIVMTGQDDYKVVMSYLNSDADRYIDKNERDASGNFTYLDKLIECILKGLTEAQRRVSFVNFLGETLEKL